MSEAYNERYKVVAGSDSCHCCFEHTVVDTRSNTGYEPKPHSTVCETFNEEDATRIAMALNMLNHVEEVVSRRGGKASFLFETLSFLRPQESDS